MGVDGMVEGRRYRVRTKDGLILWGRLAGRQTVTDPETGKSQWTVLLKEVTSAAAPAVHSGEAFILADVTAAVTELAEVR